MYKEQTASSPRGVHELNNKTSSAAFTVRESAAVANHYEMDQLLPRLTEEALLVIQTLHGRYGERLYKKVIQLAKQSLAGGLLQLEQELLSGRLERHLEAEAIIMADNKQSTMSEGFGETVDHLNEDLDFLDALASHDFRRLNKFSSGRENLGAIFSEIVENEHQMTSNFQNDVFEKNIQRIFNEDVDLEETQWPESPERMQPSLALEKNVPTGSVFSKQLSFFSFYEGATEKSRAKGLAKPGIYYMAFSIGIIGALLALAWLLLH